MSLSCQAPARPAVAAPRFLVEARDATTLVLDGQEIVRLPDLLPDGLDRHPISGMTRWASLAREAVAEFCRGQPLLIQPLLPARDRYGRLRADVTLQRDAGSLDLAQAMTGAGYVRVFPEPDSPKDRIARLLAEETQARLALRGAWQDGTFEVKDAIRDAVRSDQFAIIRGVVQRVSRIGRRHHLEFGQDWRTDLTVGLSGAVVRGLDREGSPVADLPNRLVQARGWIRLWNGPFLEVDRRDALSVFEAP